MQSLILTICIMFLICISRNLNIAQDQIEGTDFEKTDSVDIYKLSPVEKLRLELIKKSKNMEWEAPAEDEYIEPINYQTLTNLPNFKIITNEDIVIEGLIKIDKDFFEINMMPFSLKWWNDEETRTTFSYYIYAMNKSTYGNVLSFIKYNEDNYYGLYLYMATISEKNKIIDIIDVAFFEGDPPMGGFKVEWINPDKYKVINVSKYYSDNGFRTDSTIANIIIDENLIIQKEIIDSITFFPLDPEQVEYINNQ